MTNTKLDQNAMRAMVIQRKMVFPLWKKGTPRINPSLPWTAILMSKPIFAQILNVILEREMTPCPQVSSIIPLIFITIYLVLVCEYIGRFLFVYSEKVFSIEGESPVLICQVIGGTTREYLEKPVCPMKWVPVSHPWHSRFISYVILILQNEVFNIMK